MAKKTKAQLEEERLQREEEERKAKLAEEKRLNEEAERKRLEDLRIQEERRVFRENELSRLLEEQSKLNDESVTRFQRLTAEEEYEMKRVEWEQYRNPNENDTMNMSESDMNTFLSLCEENTTQDWKELFDYVQVIRNVGQSIEYKWCESLVNRNENFQRSTAINIQRCVQQIYQKLDRATANFLRFAETKLNDRSEVLVEEYAKEVSIGIWGSYADIRPIRKSIIFEKQGIQIDVPKQILQHDAGFLFRIIRLSLDPYTPTAYHPPSPSSSNGTASATATGGTRAGGITGTPISSHPPISPPSSSHGLHSSPPLYDTNQFTVIGDIITLDILRPPPPAYNLRAKRWILRDKSAIHLNLQKSHYPSSVSCKVLLRVPDEVMMTDDISLMWYDPDSCSWKPDGISDFQYTESNKTAQFYVTTVGTFALVKDRTHDFPYRRWSCTPLRPPLFSSASALSSSVSSDRAEGGENLMRFTIMTQGSQEVVIDLIGTKVKLIRPMNRQLSDLVNVELPMGILLRALAKRGLNLLPLPQTPQQSKKDVILEDTVCKQIARNASCFDFEGSSVWNDSIAKSQIGLHIRETTAFYGGLDSFNFDCVLAELDSESFSHVYAREVGNIGAPGVKFSLVLGNEYGMGKDKFLHGLRPNEVSHCELLLTMLNRMTPETRERYERVNVRFEKAVYYFLRLVKPISFS